MGTGRLEAFSDGVFAIAITLLVLEIHPPESASGLGHELAQLWPSYLAYLISFLTIGIMWINHHYLFTLIREADRTFLCLNTLLLLFTAFIPFPTNVLADFMRSGDGRTAATVFYCGTFLATGIVYNLLWRYAASGRRLLEPDVSDAEVNAISRSFLLGPTIYLASTLVALVSSWVAIAAVLAIDASYAVPPSAWRRFRRA